MKPGLAMASPADKMHLRSMNWVHPDKRLQARCEVQTLNHETLDQDLGNNPVRQVMEKNCWFLHCLE